MDDFGIMKGIASVVLTATLLTGCGSNGDVKDKNDVPSSVVVIFGEDTATIIEDEYVYYTNESGMVILEFKDGSKIKTTSDMLIMSEFDDYEKVHELVLDIVGDEGHISYYNHGASSNKKR